MKSLLNLSLVLFAILAVPVDAEDPDGVVRKAYVPSAENVHGEVSLIKRSGGMCVRSLLCSPSLARGVHEIKKKEADLWPRGSLYYADSTNYIARLNDAKKTAIDKAKSAGSDMQSLLIVFFMGEEESSFAFYDVDVSRTDAGFMIESKKLLSSHKASRNYISRSVRAMCGAAFGLRGEELRSLLESAGWRPAGDHAEPDEIIGM